MTGQVSLAVLLNDLFRLSPKKNGQPYTNKEVSEACRESGTDISEGYLSMLKNGQRSNPTRQHLQALADFFQVDPAYFFDRSVYQRTQSELAERRALRQLEQVAADPAAALLAVKSRGLVASDMLKAHAFVDNLLARERTDSTKSGQARDAGNEADTAG